MSPPISSKLGGFGKYHSYRRHLVRLQGSVILAIKNLMSTKCHLHCNVGSFITDKLVFVRNILMLWFPMLGYHFCFNILAKSMKTTELRNMYMYTQYLGVLSTGSDPILLMFQEIFELFITNSIQMQISFFNCLKG